jgi:maltooligosyltrehalose synthase
MMKETLTPCGFLISQATMELEIYPDNLGILPGDVVVIANVGSKFYGDILRCDKVFRILDTATYYAKRMHAVGNDYTFTCIGNVLGNVSIRKYFHCTTHCQKDTTVIEETLHQAIKVDKDQQDFALDVIKKLLEQRAENTTTQQKVSHKRSNELWRKLHPATLKGGE